MLGAAGGVEAGITALALRRDTADDRPKVPDEDYDLDYVTGRAARFWICDVNSLGFMVSMRAAAETYEG